MGSRASAAVLGPERRSSKQVHRVPSRKCSVRHVLESYVVNTKNNGTSKGRQVLHRSIALKETLSIRLLLIIQDPHNFSKTGTEQNVRMGQSTNMLNCKCLHSKLKIDSTVPLNASLHEGRLLKGGRDYNFSPEQNSMAFVASETRRFVSNPRKPLTCHIVKKIHYPPLAVPFQLVYPRPPPYARDVQIMSSLPQHIDARTYPVPTHAKCQMIIRF